MQDALVYTQVDKGDCTFGQHPEITDIFALISAALDNDTMVALNAKVDVDGQDPADVAESWLKDNGYIG